MRTGNEARILRLLTLFSFLHFSGVNNSYACLVQASPLHPLQSVSLAASLARDCARCLRGAEAPHLFESGRRLAARLTRGILQPSLEPEPVRSAAAKLGPPGNAFQTAASRPAPAQRLGYLRQEQGIRPEASSGQARARAARAETLWKFHPVEKAAPDGGGGRRADGIRAVRRIFHMQRPPASEEDGTRAQTKGDNEPLRSDDRGDFF